MQNIYAHIVCLLDMNLDLGTFIMMEEWTKLNKVEHYPHRRLRKTSALHRRIKELLCIMFKKLYTCLLYTLILFTLPSMMNLH